MSRLSLAAVLFLCLGCSKGSEPVSNAATEYTKNLQTSVEKAEDAAVKANAAIAASRETAEQAGALE